MLLLLALACAGQASAADVFKYEVILRPASFSGSPAGSIKVTGLDPGLTTTLTVTVGGVPQAPVNYLDGTTNLSVAPKAFTAGDTIKVEQPTGVLLETFTIPNVSLVGSVGSAALTGNAPDGTVTIASYRDTCGGLAADDFTVTPQGGAFAVVFPEPLVAGSSYSLLNYPGKGDWVRYDDIAPGETPCLRADAARFPDFPGEIPDPEPYEIRVSNLRSVVATGARLVLRRAGAIVVDHTNAATTSQAQKETAVQPLPGDVLEVYRPHTAPAPSATFTIPAISSVYDPGNSLVAIDAPAASRVESEAGMLFAMFSANRTALNTTPGRTVLNFGVDQGWEKPFSLSQANFVTSNWNSPDGTRTYSLNPALGDLTPPTLSIRLDKKYKLTKLGSSLAAKITSSEAVTVKATLTLPAKLNGSKAKAKRPRVIATAKLTIGAGVTKVKVKFTKSGKKLIKKMRKGRYPSNKATLTVAAADFSGNSGSAVKSTKLVYR